MIPSLIVKAIPAIREGDLSFDEFALAAGLGRKTSMELIGFLAKNEIGTVDTDSVTFTNMDRMHAAMLAVRQGVDIESLSNMLSWKDFEMLATSILDAYGYVTYHGLRLRKPRAEIDVVGIKDGIALLIDCKHWKRSSPSELNRFALMQVTRAKAFVKANERQVRFAVPAILTLHMESVAFADDVPIIPVLKFSSFLNEIHGYLGEIRRVVNGT